MIFYASKLSELYLFLYEFKIIDDLQNSSI